MSFEKVPNFQKFFGLATITSEMGIYKFKTFRLDVPERRLFRDGSPVSLTPKAFDTLVHLVERAGHLVEKDELIQAVWPDSFIEEGNLPRTISTLRKTLGQDNNENKFIETVPTKGYRFVADVETAASEAEPSGKTNGLIHIEPVAESAVPRSIVATETAPEPGRRRFFIGTAVIVLLLVLVTGFWISNGSLMRPWAARFSKHSPNGQAYRLFQEARTLLQRRDGESRRQALANFEKAIALDPSYAEAYAGIADVKSYHPPDLVTNDDLTIAREAVKKALELDPDNVWGHTINCRITGTNDWEFEEAVTECEHAVKLDPNDADAHRELGFALNVIDRRNDALVEMETAVALSPTSTNKVYLGMILAMSGRYDEAIDTLEQVDATDPSELELRWLMRCFMMKNDQSKAFEAFIRAQELFNGTNVEDLNAIKAAFVSGGWPAAVPVALDTPALKGRHKILVAILYTQIGDRDKAFEVLDALRRERAIIMVTVPRDPIFEPLRGDPRFDVLLAQMKLR